MEVKMQSKSHQNTCDSANEKAWNTNAYEAWINRFGTPEIAAKRVKEFPEKSVSHIYQYMGCVQHKKILNLMGSNGMKAAALAVLGADVTVVDFSEDNQRYALELAQALNVSIQYYLQDVIKLQLDETYDIIFAEMGILHYFTDLKPFFNIIKRHLSPNGIVIIRDFHPVSTKLISSRGSTANVRKHKVTGDYFSTDLVEKNVAYSKYTENDTSEHENNKVYLRLWTLGEVITQMASEHLYVTILNEEPNLSSDQFDKGIPKTFTIVAKTV